MASPIDWQIKKKKVHERGHYILETGLWSDCSFIVGTEPHQQIIPGHKLFLAMSSPVFEAMFFGGIAEKNDHPIPILDVQPEAFKALLQYIYTDEINLTSFDQACELCYGAKKYMLPHLVKECTTFLWSDLNPKNACRAYEFAKLFEEPVLMSKCLEIISLNTMEVLNENSFEEIDLRTLVTVFSQQNLNITSEIDLFNALTRYVSKQEEALGLISKKPRLESDGEMASTSQETISSTGVTVRDALKEIRFLTLTPKQFSEGPASSDLLTESEKLLILMHISTKSCPKPMPDGFSMSRAVRSRNSNCFSANSSFNDETYNIKRIEYGNDPMSTHHFIENQLWNLPRFFLDRTIIEETDCLITNVVESNITFTVDRNIFIIGVKVPAQVYSVMEPPSTRSFYSELLYAHLTDAEGSRLTYSHYSARVNYLSIIEVAFNRPVFLTRNKEYKICVAFNRPGWYPMGTCAIEASSANVVFNFGSGPQGHSVRDGLIRSIIFTY